MSQAINCNYARATVRALIQKHRKSNKHLPDTDKALQNFNAHFNKTNSLQATKEIALKRFFDVSKFFYGSGRGKNHLNCTFKPSQCMPGNSSQTKSNKSIH